MQVIRHEKNRGVGGAMKTGFARANQLGVDVVVKLDGDDQMDAAQIVRLCKPLLADNETVNVAMTVPELPSVTGGESPTARLGGASSLRIVATPAV